MKRKILYYTVFFFVLVFGFIFVLTKVIPGFGNVSLPVLSYVQPFSFIDQDGKTITERDVDGKVYVTEYFFTTCKGICPKMNSNMRRIYDEFKGNSDFMIISHTCMPETDSAPVLKVYEQKMLTGNLKKSEDGSYRMVNDTLNK